MTPDQIQKLNTLYDKFSSLSSSSSIPRDVETAFRERLGLSVTAQAFPIGAIYTSITGTNPSTELGYGTWSAFGTGKVIVGVDTGDSNFNTVEKTGGESTHTLTITEIPSHTHTTDLSKASGGITAGSAGTINTNSGVTGSAGGGGAHNNLQPYITAYFWKRTA